MDLARALPDNAAMSSDWKDKWRRATVLSIQGMVQSLTMAGLAPAIGATTDGPGLPWAFVASGSVIAVAVVAFGPAALARTRRPDLRPALPAFADD